MELNEIKKTTKWNEAATAINENNQKINVEVIKLNHATNRNKGLHKTVESLKTAVVSPREGDWAIIGKTIPGPIWGYSDGDWHATGEIGGGPEIIIPEISGQFGDSPDKAISQKFFTEQIRAIENDIGSESTSDSEDGTVWGKLISIIQDVDSNSSSISALETILSKSSLFKNLGIITGLSDLDTVDTPGYYTYTKSLNEGEAINGILVVSKVSYPGSFSFLQIRHELGKTYQREYDLDERVWGEWEEQTVVMSEDDYEQLAVKNQSTFYYTYEEE